MQFDNPCLLVGMFGPLKFNAIINIVGFKCTVFLCLYHFILYVWINGVFLVFYFISSLDLPAMPLLKMFLVFVLALEFRAYSASLLVIFTFKHYILQVKYKRFTTVYLYSHPRPLRYYHIVASML